MMITNLDQIARHLCSLIPVQKRWYEIVGTVSIFLDVCTCVSAFPYMRQSVSFCLSLPIGCFCDSSKLPYNEFVLCSYYCGKSCLIEAIYSLVCAHSDAVGNILIDRFFFAEFTNSISSVDVSTNKVIYLFDWFYLKRNNHRLHCFELLWCRWNCYWRFPGWRLFTQRMLVAF